MTDQPQPEYRIEDLARLSGATVRTIRAYQDRGLLPRPERRGRANVYGDAHLTRLRQITDLLERGYTLASIKELLEAWDAGRDLGGVLGLAAEVDGPWSEEQSTLVTVEQLHEAFGGATGGSGLDEAALAEAVELGILEPVPDRAGVYAVPSPQELAVAAELHSAGVPLTAVATHLREVRAQVEHIASRFLDFTTEHVFQPFLDRPPTEAAAAEAAALIRRLRPLARQTIDAELARAMRTLATRHLREHLAGALPPAGAPGAHDGADAAEGRGSGAAGGRVPGVGAGARGPFTAGPRRCGSVPRPAREAGVAPPAGTGPASDPRAEAGRVAVTLPADAVAAVRELVGAENTAPFIAAAARREVQARALDSLMPPAPPVPTRPHGPGGAAPKPGPDGSGEPRDISGG
ncbi:MULTISPECIES: MerR family transcriptional regulator [Streptomyces]|uniref:MerR family transcriptional regulator n=1 Tax=Streptomyces ramulosus TaxID=47762 RepID=A0ABW1FNI2_9ACTN